MNVLIVHAHPEPASFCASMARIAVETLEGSGHSVQLSDLYAMQWDPVAKASDFKRRSNPDYLTYALEQRAAHRTGDLADDIQGELEKLLWADCLLLSFPLFWGSVPAMLKGWIDRVMISGVCYGGKRFYDQGGLASKKAALNLTAGAQPHMFADENAIHGGWAPMLRHLERATLAYTGMQVLPRFVAHHVPYLPQAERDQIMDDYRRYLLDLEHQPAIVFPKLADYDEHLNPMRPSL